MSTEREMTLVEELSTRYKPHTPSPDYDALAADNERLKADAAPINLDDKPALRWCLTGPWGWHQGGPSNSCEMCPFSGGYCDSQGRDIPYSEIANDPSESYYRCDLLNQIVWGEYSPCEQTDWQQRARSELGLKEGE